MSKQQQTLIVAKTRGFWRFCSARMNPLRGSARSRWFFAISDLPARPSAGIREMQKLEFFLFFLLRFCRCPRNPRFFVFLTFPDEHSAGIVRVDALSLWRRANSC